MILKLQKSLLIIYTSMLLCISVAGAETFPPKIEAIVQDDEKVMDPSQVKQLNDIVGKLPQKYKIMIIPSTEQLSTQEYSKELFNEYGLSQDYILLVFNQDKQELGVKVGSLIEEKGMTEDVIKQTVDHFFVPYAKQKSYMTGISTAAQQLSDIAQNGPTASLPQGFANSMKAEEDGLSAWSYVAVVLVVLLGSGVYVYMQRKKWTQEMDDIEEWMDKIEEKIKLLAEDRIVKLKEKENFIVSLIERVRKDSLPHAEVSLLEAESMCDRFRFKKASYFVQQTKDLLASIDNEISQVQSKLFQTKITEEECERITEEIRKASTVLERKLDETSLHFGVTFYEYREVLEQNETWLKATPKAIEDDATTLLEQLNAKKQILMERLKEIEDYPNLKQEVAVTLDREVLQLQGDLQEMLTSGYQLPPDFYENLTLKMKEEIINLQGLLSEGRIKGMSSRVLELKDQIDSTYDMMEEIVTKKAMIEHYLKEIPTMLDSLEIEKKQLADELEELSLRYSVQEGAIFNYYLALQKVCQEVGDQLFLARQMDSGNDIEFIQVVDNLEVIQTQIEQLLLHREEAYEELEELRKGEFEAKDTLIQLHSELIRVEQQIRRKNLPGIPNHLTDMIELGKRSLFEIEMVLDQVPLELQKINTLVKEAKEYTERIVKDTENIFKQCQIVEEKIQQTNRYRSQSGEINHLLNEAEEAFRNAEYEQASQFASEAYELAMGRTRGRTLKGTAFKFKK